MPDVTVRLSGTDGNAFSIMGKVATALRRAGLREEASEFIEEATSSHSYDEMLQCCMWWVHVE